MQCQVGPLPEGVQLCDSSKELNVVLRLAKRAHYFGLRYNRIGALEEKKETIFLLSSLFAYRHTTLTTLAAESLKANWVWFMEKFEFEAWLCASWVGWCEGKRVAAKWISDHIKSFAQTDIPHNDAPFHVLSNAFVNGTLQSEVLAALHLSPQQSPDEWWSALQAVLNDRFPQDPMELPLRFHKDGSLVKESVNRAYFLTHVVLLICRYGQADPFTIVRLSRSTMSLLSRTIESYFDDTSMMEKGNEEVHWELCSALQCLGVDRLEVSQKQAQLVSRFESVEIEPAAVSLDSVYQEMHYHLLAGVLVAGPARVIEW